MARRRSSSPATSIALFVVGGGLLALAAALALRPSDAQRHRDQAAAHLEDGSFDGAVAALERALAATPADGASGRAARFALLIQHGDCNLKLRLPKSALESFQEAQQLRPGETLAWERVGTALLALERHSEAAIHFEEAALTFPERGRHFGFVAGCAYYRRARGLLESAEKLLEPRARPGRRDDLEHALERFTSTSPTRPTRAQIEGELLEPPHGTSELDRAFALLLDARGEFERADDRLSAFDLEPDPDPAIGLVRVEMHLHAGRHYELQRLAAILLRLPALPGSEEARQRMRVLAANGAHEAGCTDEAVAAFMAMRRYYAELAAPALAGGDEARAKGLLDSARRAGFLAVEERLAARQGKQALEILASLGAPPPTNMLHQCYVGYARFLAGDLEKCRFPLELAAKSVIERVGRSHQFRDDEHRQSVLAMLAEGLAACDRSELAVKILELSLEGARDPEAVLSRLIELKRPLRDRTHSIADAGFELLKLGRGGGGRLAAWEADWREAQGRGIGLERRIADQVGRVLRVFGHAYVADPQLASLMRLATSWRRAPRNPETAVQTAGSILLKELDDDAGMTLQVYRALCAAGRRDQAYLLLFGLAHAHPGIADLRLLLAQHEIAEGHFEDAADSLENLLELDPEDVRAVELAHDVARRRGDPESARRVEELALRGRIDARRLRIAARFALEDGYPGITLAIARGADVKDPDGRALLALAALAHARAGRVDDAETLSIEILAAEPTQPQALAAGLRSLVARGDSPDRPTCAEFVDRDAARFAALDPAVLRDLARELFDAGGFEAGEKLAQLALEREPGSADCERLLADLRLAQARFDEIVAAPDPEPGDPHALEQLRRLTLEKLVRDGSDAAWRYLRERVIAGHPEAGLARWLGLIGLAAGHVEPAADLLVRRNVKLSELDERFIALAVVAHESKVPERELPAGAASRLRRLSNPTLPRDRELEKLLSFQLVAIDHRFLESLLEYVLLGDLPEYRPIQAAREDVLRVRYPGLGFLARAEALAHDEAGRPEEAARLLARQLAEDPGDAESLLQLVPFLPWLDVPGLSSAVAAAAEAEIPAPFRDLVTGWNDVAGGARSLGIERLRAAAADPVARPAALLLLARALAPAPDLPRLTPAGLSPWCEAAVRSRMHDETREVDPLLLAAARQSSEQPILMRSIARRYARARESLDPDVRRALASTLVETPGPWFEPFEHAIDDLVAAGPDVDAVRFLGNALEASVASLEGAPLADAGLRSLVRLSDLARSLDLFEEDERWLDLARRACPYHPEVLLASARAAIARGEPAAARDHLEAAVAFGVEDPGILIWLAEHEHGTGEDLPRALRWAQRAQAAAAASGDSSLVARAFDVIAKTHFLLGDEEASRLAWVESSKARGENPRLCSAIGLEGFARLPAKTAILRLAPIAEAEGPARELARFLLDAAEREQAAQAGAATSEEGSPPPGE